MKLIYVSPEGSSGYARVAEDFMLGLHDEGVELSWQPYHWAEGGTVPFRGETSCESLRPFFYKELSQPDLVILHIMPAYLESWLERFPSTPTVVHTVWETDRLRAEWVEVINRTLGVVVPCEWNREVFATSGVSVPIEVVPYMIPKDVTPMERSDQCRRFYTINDWTYRKAMPELVMAFLRAFPDGGATLTIKTNTRDRTAPKPWYDFFPFKALATQQTSTAAAVRRVKAESASSKAEVKLLAGELTRNEILEIHRENDCYVSLTRSEGWGMGAFEAAAIGNPVVMTGFGGQSEFLKPDLCSIVNHTLKPCLDDGWYTARESWAEPDVVDAVRKLKKVHAHPEEAHARARLLREKCWTDYEPGRVAGIYRECLQRLSRRA
ncbi:MAG: glycosyltransferase [Candidatus Eremiobacteraeota bacterium]|nr:glycosyltransferase [Candidatus Eremiobacteraeota bacterium]